MHLPDRGIVTSISARVRASFTNWFASVSSSNGEESTSRQPAACIDANAWPFDERNVKNSNTKEFEYNVEMQRSIYLPWLIGADRRRDRSNHEQWALPRSIQIAVRLHCYSMSMTMTTKMMSMLLWIKFCVISQTIKWILLFWFTNRNRLLIDDATQHRRHSQQSQHNSHRPSDQAKIKQYFTINKTKREVKI